MKYMNRTKEKKRNTQKKKKKKKKNFRLQNYSCLNLLFRSTSHAQILTTFQPQKEYPPSEVISHAYIERTVEQSIGQQLVIIRKEERRKKKRTFGSINRGTPKSTVFLLIT